MQEKLGRRKPQQGARRMQTRGSPRVPKNTSKESSEKTITNIHRQVLEETNGTVLDTAYKMPPHGHEDETDSEDGVGEKNEENKKQ